MSLLTIVICAFIIIATFLLWEGMAWLMHKYVMHGFLWRWHRSHHKAHSHAFEWNDLFFLVFSLPAIGIFYYFTRVNFNPYMTAVGIGIFSYGIFYLVFHDVIVHQRIKWKLKKKSRYLQRMINAHHVHHARHTKDGCEAFGFLFAPKKYEPKTSPDEKHQTS